MKKDFSQPFTKNHSLIFLIIQESVSGQFVLFTSQDSIDEYGKDDAYETLKLTLENEDSLALHVTKYLIQQGFALNTLRELVRETRVGFSFDGDTSGQEGDVIALHVQVDMTNQNSFVSREAVYLALDEYIRRIRGALFGDRVIDLATAKLLSEQFGESPKD